MAHRPNIAKFQARLKGLLLGHGTRASSEESIRRDGLRGEYNYFCIDKGWEFDSYESPVNVQFRADGLADRTYVDPEGQWGQFSSLAEGVAASSLDEVLDELERAFDGELATEWEDPFDPRNYNLVVIGQVGPEHLA